jgi:Skp family chaperone for outer membrane proteins
VLVAGGVLILAVVLVAGRLAAQQGGQAAPAAAPPPRTRIALLNLTYVIKKYKKFETFQAEIKTAFEPFQKHDQGKKAEAEALAKEGQKPETTEARREEINRQLKALQRDIEDNGTSAKAFLQKKGDEQMRILYMDIMSAAQRYARGHDYEMVLHYNEATTQEDFYSPVNIARKIQAGALMPLYFVPGMDISKEVVDTLNAYLGAAPAATNGGAPGGQ